ncbi:MAG: efflux RND transporter permease subunit [Verrucomicrobia bacterium]|nr:efflux RND transporter permease subunit [Verrucomicrobiota bacterium]
MQKLAEICIRRPVFATMIILALVVTGAAGYAHLGVDRSPPVDIPTVYVSTRLPGASPVEMEALVSQVIEENVNTIEGITDLRSISGQGISFVIIQFDLRRDVSEAAEDVRNRLGRIGNDLPREADPPQISKFDSDRSPAMTLALTGDRSRRELTELADKVVKVHIERSMGVGEVQIRGGLERAISIWVDPDRLAAYQIPITAVREAIVRQNVDVPGGYVTTPLIEHTLRTLGRFTGAAQFNELVVATRHGAPIRIRDIGWAEDGTREERSLTRLNGQSAVTLEVRRQSDANTVAVIEGVKQKLPQVIAQLPPDVRFEVIEDQSRYIYEALREIRGHLILGSILASLVVFFFMRSWRATCIAAVAIPCSVISTFGMMWALDFTLNSVTMLALVLMVGIVIDDAIVVLENIFRFVEEKGMNPFEAARAATAEIGTAVMATTLSLVVIFVPVSFMSSIAGRFLYQFGLTAAVAVLVSLLVSFTLTPTMSARLFSLRAVRAGASGAVRSRTGFYAYLDRSYAGALRWAMRHRLAVSVGAVCVMLSALPLYQAIRQEYTPGNTDEGEFEVSVSAREGTSLAAMNEVARQVEAELLSMPQVRVILASVGSTRIGGANQIRAYVRIAPHQERVFSWTRLFSLNPLAAFQGNYGQRDVVQQVRQRLRQIPEVRIGVRSGQSSISVGGPNVEIDFSLLGPELESLVAYAEELRRRAPALGILDADTTLRLDKPELRVEIDRARAAALGVDTQDIATALRIMVGGDERVSRFRDPTINEDYDVQLRLAEGSRNDPEVISRLFVPRRDGGLVRLDNLVEIVPGQTASRIDRLDRQRTISLRGAIAPGFALADRLQALRNAVRELNLPAAYSTRVSGRGRELESTFNEFLWAFLLSIVFMYMILASQFESVSHPFTILLSLPLSLPFALLSLWASGNTLNLYSALGLLVLFGVVKKNAILQIDHMNQLRARGLERSVAILQANRDRLRPILMTTLTLVAGMTPLALGTGPGAEERRAVAVVVIGGQALCLFLTLIATPVAYSLLDDLAQRLHWRRLVRQPAPAAAPAGPVGSA